MCERQLARVERVTVCNNPRLAFTYRVEIAANGNVFYEDSMDLQGKAFLRIPAGEARRLMDASSSFVFGEQEPYARPQSIRLDGRSWEVRLLCGTETLGAAEGGDGESARRTAAFQRLAETIEQALSKEMGSRFLSFAV